MSNNGHGNKRVMPPPKERTLESVILDNIPDELSQMFLDRLKVVEKTMVSMTEYGSSLDEVEKILMARVRGKVDVGDINLESVDLMTVLGGLSGTIVGLLEEMFIGLIPVIQSNRRKQDVQTVKNAINESTSGVAILAQSLTLTLMMMAYAIGLADGKGEKNE